MGQVTVCAMLNCLNQRAGSTSKLNYDSHQYIIESLSYNEICLLPARCNSEACITAATNVAIACIGTSRGG